MMKATTNSGKKKPSVQVEDDYDTTYRPDDSFDGVRVTLNESFGAKSASATEEWQVDLGAFNEGELALLLSAMGPVSENNQAKAAAAAARDEQAQLMGGVETDQSSTGSEEDDDDDDFSWVHGLAAVDEDDKWEVLSTGESVISLSSDAAIVWTYKDALKLGKTKANLENLSTSANQQPTTTGIRLQSSCRARENMNLSRSHDFDADFVRDGVKLARGGCPARMFKGNPAPTKKKKS